VRLHRYFALCLLLLLPWGARADDVGPAQAQALQQQLRAWLAGLVGPEIALPDPLLRVTGEGDHYRMAWPIPGLDDRTGDAALTASERPLDGGRWAIEGISLPGSANFTMTIPDTGDIATSKPLKAKLTVGRQDSRGEIDPALVSPSALHIDLGNLAITTDSAKEHQEQLVDRYVADTSLKPVQEGRLDLLMDATMDGWRSAVRAEGGSAVAIAAQKIHALGRIDGASRDKVMDLVAAMNAFYRALPPDVAEKHGKVDLSAPARVQLRTMINALPAILAGVRLQETVDGLQVEVAGMGGFALQHALLGFGGDAPDGNLHVWFDIGLDGLETPSLPPKVAEYLPKHVELRPSISGIRTADLTKLALDATEEAADDRIGPDIGAIFSHGGINLGLETLSFDLGPAKVEGVGRFVMLSPETWRGNARLSATGIDELTAQARTNADLQQALPALIMLRGLAKPDGDRLVWEIASEGTSVTVNGIDLSQLGGDKPKGKPPNAPPGQPHRR
jgi:hypothetical protein